MIIDNTLIITIIIIMIKIYFSLTSHGLFPEKQKGCRGIGELLYIDQRILNEIKAGWKNLATAWIDYKKTYMVPQR